MLLALLLVATPLLAAAPADVGVPHGVEDAGTRAVETARPATDAGSPEQSAEPRAEATAGPVTTPADPEIAQELTASPRPTLALASWDEALARLRALGGPGARAGPAGAGRRRDTAGALAAATQPHHLTHRAAAPGGGGGINVEGGGGINVGEGGEDAQRPTSPLWALRATARQSVVDVPAWPQLSAARAAQATARDVWRLLVRELARSLVAVVTAERVVELVDRDGSLKQGRSRGWRRRAPPLPRRWRSRGRSAPPFGLGRAAQAGRSPGARCTSGPRSSCPSRWPTSAAESVQNVTVVSDYKDREFGQKYGVYMKELGLLARSTFVVDRNGKVVFRESVREMPHEPDYDAALAAVRAAL